ncbi:hypothetical protein ILUMI_14106, partial [Ignelater luminosus]
IHFNPRNTKRGTFCAHGYEITELEEELLKSDDDFEADEIKGDSQVSETENEEIMREEITSNLDDPSDSQNLILGFLETEKENEELEATTKGRCPFKVVIKQKPGKYEILIRMLTDAETRHVLSMEPYAGKNETM